MTKIRLDTQVQWVAPAGSTIDADLYKYQIVTSVSSWNLTVALKNYLWQDPSVAVPVKVQIWDTIRTITDTFAWISRTLNAWTNWFNAWSSELATKEIDYFVYWMWDATNTWQEFSIRLARIPYATTRADFSTSSTNEKYWTTGAPASSECVLLWRINAILSAWPSYTWSLWTWPIINQPITSTRFLDYVPNWAWFSWTAKYKIDWETMFLIIDSTANITWNITTPFTCTNTVDNQMNTDTWTAVLPKNSNTITVATNPQNINWFYWI